MEKELDAALKRLRQEAPGPDATGPCPSADVVAAFMDGTLPAHERALVETHAADCPRCLQVLAAMAQTTPEVPAAPVAWWRVPWRVRWVVPAMAGATALVLWIYVGSQGPAPVVREAAPPERTSTAPSEPASAPQQSGGAEAKASPAAPEFPRSLPARSSPDDRELAKRESAKEASAPPPPPPSAPASPPFPVPSLPPAETSAGARADSDARLRATVESEGKPSAPGAPATVVSRTRVVATPADPRRRAEAGSRDALADSATLRPQTRALDVISPDPATRWRVDGPSIERSTDGGRTWTRQFTADVTLLAGHAPAPGVCWIAGQQGVVLVSRDGRTWQQVASPAAVDLIGVTAVDDRAATVTAADGRLFHTSDGGRTWSPQEHENAPY